eukprot:m.117476 g.117476  ORF g.117476 m.117476 type:complete len:92 (+) comp37614_c0_seq7:1429-1704(+)
MAWQEIPEDPLEAETYYTQRDSFEVNSDSDDEGEDEYFALVDCLQDALDLSESDCKSPTLPEEESVILTSHGKNENRCHKTTWGRTISKGV